MTTETRSMAAFWPVNQLLSTQVATFITVAAKSISETWNQQQEQQPQQSKCLPEFRLSEVAEHNNSEDCWIVIYDKVYDITKFLPLHLGGEFILLEYAGRDATIAFRSTRHGDDSYQLLEKYLIGNLVETERIYKKKSTLSRQG